MSYYELDVEENRRNFYNDDKDYWSCNFCGSFVESDGYSYDDTRWCSDICDNCYGCACEDCDC